MRDYKIFSQTKKSKDDVLISVRLYDSSCNINYWLSEYDQETEVAYGYITEPSGIFDMWAYFPIYKMDRLNFENGFKRIYIDDFFIPKKFKDLPFNKKKDS